MFAPIRFFFSLRERPSAGLVAAASAVAVLFSSTPFLIPAVAVEYDIPVGRAGLISAVQVGAFALTTFSAGRLLRTHRRYLVIGGAVAVIGNMASTIAPGFLVLLSTRAVTGGAAGLLVWLSWANAMRSSGDMRRVAAVGPLAVFLAAPILSAVVEWGGADAGFALVALTFVPCMVLPAEFSGFRFERRRLSPSRSNVVLIVGLAINTLSGSSLFVFAAAIGAARGLDPTVVALAFSANALAGWLIARRPAPDRAEGRGTLGMAACAAAVALVPNGVAFMIGLTVWGAAFWFSTPRVLRAVAAWSLAPEERVGDAQSAMAAGRALGPAVGALLVVGDSFTVLGGFAVAGLIISGTIYAAVGRYRLHNPPPPGATAA